MTVSKQAKTEQYSGDEIQFCVVVNQEEQYSYWFHNSPLPAGWKGTGFVGSQSECLIEIDKIWTDMRPLSVRKAIQSGLT
jgi:MbtH protein